MTLEQLKPLEHLMSMQLKPLVLDLKRRRLKMDLDGTLPSLWGSLMLPNQSVQVQVQVQVVSNQLSRSELGLTSMPRNR